MNKLVLLSFVVMILSFSTIASEVKTFINPVEQSGTGLYFSLRSDFEGVCKNLGYDHLLKGSVFHAMRTYKKDNFEPIFIAGDHQTWHWKTIAEHSTAIIVDDDGTPIKEVYSRYISSITCIKNAP